MKTLLAWFSKPARPQLFTIAGIKT